MAIAYGWIDAEGKFCLSSFPATHVPRPHNTYDTPDGALAEASKRGMTLQWENPALVDVWVKAHSEKPMMTGIPAGQSNGAAAPPATIDHEIIPPAKQAEAVSAAKPAVSSIAAAMSITPAKSTATGTLADLQALKDVVAAINAERVEINMVTAKLQTKLATIQDQRKTLADFADKLGV